MLNGIANGYAVSVADFPVAWKIEAVNDAKYQNFEYVRYGLTSPTTSPALLTLCSSIFWGSTNMVWDLAQWGAKHDGTRVRNHNPSTLASKQ